MVDTTHDIETAQARIAERQRNGQPTRVLENYVEILRRINDIPPSYATDTDPSRRSSR